MNEYLNDRPSSAKMSDSVSGRCTPLKSDQKRWDLKEIYNMRKKLFAGIGWGKTNKSDETVNKKKTIRFKEKEMNFLRKNNFLCNVIM